MSTTTKADSGQNSLENGIRAYFEAFDSARKTSGDTTEADTIAKVAFRAHCGQPSISDPDMEDAIYSAIAGKAHEAFDTAYHRDLAYMDACGIDDALEAAEQVERSIYEKYGRKPGKPLFAQLSQVSLGTKGEIIASIIAVRPVNVSSERPREFRRPQLVYSRD